MSKLYETYNKFNEAMTATKVRVFCRICYANIWEPKSILGSEPKFSVSCLFRGTLRLQAFSSVRWCAC